MEGLESIHSFAMSINSLLLQNDEFNLKVLHLFWNQVDERERTDLYQIYEQTFKELELNLMTTYIPDANDIRRNHLVLTPPSFALLYFWLIGD